MFLDQFISTFSDRKYSVKFQELALSTEKSRYQQSTTWTRRPGNRQFREQRSETPDASRKARRVDGQNEIITRINLSDNTTISTHIRADGMGGGSRGIGGDQGDGEDDVNNGEGNAQ